MNNNAMTSPSTIKVKETITGGLHSSVGFPGFQEEGYVQSQEERVESLKANGFDVDITDKGILVTPKA